MRLNMISQNVLNKVLSPELYNLYNGANNIEDFAGDTEDQDYNSLAEKMLEDMLENMMLDNESEDNVTTNRMGAVALATSILMRAVEYVPVDTGNLRDNIYMDTKTGDGSVKVCVDEEEAPYALYVHEIGLYNHPVGRYKYLEDAAFDVGNETGELDRISISYSPLCVYVDSSIGHRLGDIKDNEEINSNSAIIAFTKNQLIEYAMDENRVNNTEYNDAIELINFYDKSRPNIKKRFGKQWLDRLVAEWLDRKRHD